jgi:hypothetical protein
VLEYGVAMGEFRELDIPQAVRLLMAPIQFAYLYVNSLLPFDEDFEAQAYLDTHIDLFLRGIRALPETRLNEELPT